ncbi:unnamed protein product [Enterobius vermicularis]|uniref:MICOS complex subunit MIC60 n=1 Tax=Enterobius vermicularis TaxID=51028 RepID=A0A3P6HFJ0_ENTVE|nr:unnamed protein product [Enterobius vermicularis]
MFCDFKDFAVYRFRRKGSFAKKFFVTTSLVAGAVGSAVAYAYYDPISRTKFEEKVPYGKDLFDYVDNTKDNIMRSVNYVTLFYLFYDNSVLENIASAKLEASLKAAIMSAESRVKMATEAKLLTIAAINEHAELLKNAVSSTKKADWDAVSRAVEKADKASREDLAEENEARNYLDSVRKIINEGKRSNVTRYNPLLINAVETVNKLDEQLDELKLAVRKTRDESRRINHFQDLIKRSRRVYADELKDLLPGLDGKVKDASLTEDDLNMLVAHAHLKVTQLRQQLADQQVVEEENIAKAVEEQRLLDNSHAKEELDLELKRLKDQLDVDYERRLVAKRREWEEEAEEHLRNVASAHSEHLEQVVRTQKQLCDIEQKQKVIEEAVGAERKWNSEQILNAQQKLEGIEVALNSRLAADIEHRRSKQFWIACQNLVASVVYGKKAGLTPEERRNPLLNELNVIKDSSVGDEYVQNVIRAFSEEIIHDGVYPEQDLRTRFSHVYKMARRVAKIDENGGGLMQYLTSYLQSAITFDVPRNYSFSFFESLDKIDPDVLDNYEILSRTKYFVDKGDLTSAVRVAQLLKGEPGRLARDWIRDTRVHLEARFLVDLLLAHAAVLNITTTYHVS